MIGMHLIPSIGGHIHPHMHTFTVKARFFFQSHSAHIGQDTANMQQMPRLWESAEPARCGGRKSSVVFFTLLPCHFSLFFFQLGQSCCGPRCRVPRARRWNSNMDHLTPVKTALLVERQALSACRGKCYAASQFSPSSPPRLPLSSSPTPVSVQHWLILPLHLSPLSLLDLSLIRSLLPSYLSVFRSFFSHRSRAPALYFHPSIFVPLTLDVFTVQIPTLNSRFRLISSSSSFQIMCSRLKATSDANKKSRSQVCFFDLFSQKHVVIVLHTCHSDPDKFRCDTVGLHENT